MFSLEVLYVISLQNKVTLLCVYEMITCSLELAVYDILLNGI